MTEHATCEATTGCNRTPTHGRICQPHLDRLSSILRDIEDQAAVLSAMPSFAIKTGRTGGLASHRSPAVLDAIVASDPRRGNVQTNDPLAYDDTASVLDTLHTWAQWLRRDRGLTLPATITVTGERDTLTRHLDWIAAQPYIAAFYTELTALLAQLKRTNHTHDDKPAARCHLTTDTGPCDGPIHVDYNAGHAHCGNCRATWDAPHVATLIQQIDQLEREAARPHTPDGRPMLTPHELVAQGYTSSISNVTTRAGRRGHTATQGHYDPAIFEKVTA